MPGLQARLSLFRSFLLSGFFRSSFLFGRLLLRLTAFNGHVSFLSVAKVVDPRSGTPG